MVQIKSFLPAILFGVAVVNALPYGLTTQIAARDSASEAKLLLHEPELVRRGVLCPHCKANFSRKELKTHNCEQKQARQKKLATQQAEWDKVDKQEEARGKAEEKKKEEETLAKQRAKVAGQEAAGKANEKAKAAELAKLSPKTVYCQNCGKQHTLQPKDFAYGITCSCYDSVQQTNTQKPKNPPNRKLSIPWGMRHG